MLLMRAIRVTKSLPLYELARRTRISPSRLSLIERELATATQEEQGRIAQSLQVKARVLFQPATAAALVRSGVEGGGHSEP